MKRNAKYWFRIALCAGLISIILSPANSEKTTNTISALCHALSPFLFGFLFAYFLDPAVKRLEHLLRRRKHPRTLGICIVLLGISAAAFGFAAFILPMLFRNGVAVLEQLPQYFEHMADALTAFCSRFGFSIDRSALDLSALQDFLRTRLSEFSGELAAMGIDLASGIIRTLSDLSVALISGVYLLFFKEHFIAALKKLLFALFPQTPIERAIDLMRDSNKIFMDYLYSKLLTSLIVGGATLVLMLLCSLPNAPLLSAVMTVFNIIPFFGPILGAIPGVLLLLTEQPYDALIFILITIFVQFLDNQFFTPKLVGERVGINPLWVLVAIVLGGFFGGITGMFFGIPIFAVLLGILKLFVNRRLREKGLSTDTMDYATKK